MASTTAPATKTIASLAAKAKPPPSSSSSSSSSLVRNLAPYLFKSKNEPPSSPLPSEKTPPLFLTSGSLEEQTQHNLTPAERHFVFNMIPKAFLTNQYVKHCEKTSKMGTSLITTTFVTSFPVHPENKPSGLDMANSKYEMMFKQRDRLEELNERLDMMKKILGLTSASEKMVQKWNIQRAIELFRRNPKDTGSSEVQAAVMTVRINHLKDHLETHRKDHRSSRELSILEGKRKRHLKYLKRQDLKRYCETLNALGLKDIDT